MRDRSFSIPLTLSLPLALAACAGPSFVLDEAAVVAQVEWLSEAVPTCEALADAGSGARALAPALRALRPALVAQRVAAAGAGPQSLHLAGFGADGSCGGAVTVSSDHADGDTEYVVELDGFCVDTADGDLVLDGVLEAREDGTPSDDGPVIASTSMRTDGPVEVAHGGETFTVTVEEARTDYGAPAPWAPDPADESSPDVTTVDAVEVAFTDHDRDAFVRDLRLERIGGLYGGSIHVLTGQMGTEQEGWVRIRTSADEPIGIALSGGQLVSEGALVLEGASGTEAVVRIRDGAVGVIEVTLDDAVVPMALDCSEGVLPALEIAQALVGALPAY